MKLQQGKLLDKKGHLAQHGWHTDTSVAQYNRKDIVGKKWRIKEWDYYIITNGKYALALTIADNSYMSLISASFVDYQQPSYKTTSVMKFFTFGKLGLPSNPQSGNLSYRDKRVNMNFCNDNGQRTLSCNFANFDGDKSLVCDIVIDNDIKDSMVIATPFDNKPRHFYYNVKTNCMTARGYVTVGDTTYQFDHSDSLATLDWGRGIWTYDNTWYWSSLSCRLPDNRKFAFNLGYGFGNTSDASENMLFVDGIAHKLDQVTFNIPQDAKGDDYMSPWTFTSNDNRLNLQFVPIIDRMDITNLLVLASFQHQVFGYFSGQVVLDDGSTIQLDNVIGFAEKVRNKW